MRFYDPGERTIGNILADKARNIEDGPFLRCEGRTFSYAEANAVTNSYANGFRALGIKKGDHVALMLENCPELLWAMWGLGKIGAVAVPLNTAAKGELLAYLLDQSDSVLLCTSDDFRERVTPVLDGVPAVRGVLGLDELREFARLPAEEPVGMRDV